MLPRLYRFHIFRRWQSASGFHNGSSTTCTMSEFLLFVNATIENVGGGNTSIGPYFTAWLRSPVGANVSNGELGVDALFPGQRLGTTIPSHSGGVYLSPGAKVRYWLIFYIPGVNQSNAQKWSLQYLSLREFGYGGNWVGEG